MAFSHWYSLVLVGFAVSDIFESGGIQKCLVRDGSTDQRLCLEICYHEELAQGDGTSSE